MMIHALILAGTALAWYFPIAFFIRSEWNSNPAGKSQMTFSLIVALVLTLSAVRLVFGITLPDWARLTVYGLVVIGLATQAITLTKIQNRRSARIARERDESESIKEPSP